jgi:hypothetical protein
MPFSVLSCLADAPLERLYSLPATRGKVARARDRAAGEWPFQA